MHRLGAPALVRLCCGEERSGRWLCLLRFGPRRAGTYIKRAARSPALIVVCVRVDEHHRRDGGNWPFAAHKTIHRKAYTLKSHTHKYAVRPRHTDRAPSYFIYTQGNGRAANARATIQNRLSRSPPRCLLYFLRIRFSSIFYSRAPPPSPAYLVCVRKVVGSKLYLY